MFDTALDDFNFAQLFSVNRYLGNDRIGDANQLTLALTSRLLDAGDRRRAPARRRRPALLLQDQRVTLNEAPRSASTSDFLARRRGPAVRRLGARRACGSTTSTRRRPSASTSASATRRRRAASFNASYRYTRQLVDPVGRHVAAEAVRPLGAVAGRRQLDAARALELLARRQQDAGGGRGRRVQWRLLGAAPRRPAADDDDADDDRHSVYLQIELNGLARFGTNPLELLRRSVPGYQQTNDPTRVAARSRRSPFPEY